MTFADLVKGQLKKCEMRQADAATALGIAHDQFRLRLSRNQFTQEETIKLKSLLQLTPGLDDLKGMQREGKHLKARRPTAAAAISPKVRLAIAQVDRAARRSRNPMTETAARYRAATESMGETGLVAVISETVTPVEMEQSENAIAWRLSLAKAIAGGATLLYIRPDNSRLKSNKRYEFSKILTMGDQESEIRQLREKLGMALEKVAPTRDIKTIISQKVLQIYCEDSAFFVPGLSFGMYHAKDGVTETLLRMSIGSSALPGMLWIDDSVQTYRMLSFVRLAVDSILDGGKKPWPAKPDEQEEGVKGPLRLVRNLLRDYRGLEETVPSPGAGI